MGGCAVVHVEEINHIAYLLGLLRGALWLRGLGLLLLSAFLALGGDPLGGASFLFLIEVLVFKRGGPLVLDLGRIELDLVVDLLSVLLQLLPDLFLLVVLLYLDIVDNRAEVSDAIDHQLLACLRHVKDIVSDNGGFLGEHDLLRLHGVRLEQSPVDISPISEIRVLVFIAAELEHPRHELLHLFVIGVLQKLLDDSREDLLLGGLVLVMESLDQLLQEHDSCDLLVLLIGNHPLRNAVSELADQPREAGPRLRLEYGIPTLDHIRQ